MRLSARGADSLDGVSSRRRAPRAPGYRRNLQRAYLDHAHHLLHDAESQHWTPPGSGNLRVGRNDDPPLNADLHIAQSDIRPLIRDQLTLLQREIRSALDRGVRDA